MGEFGKVFDPLQWASSSAIKIQPSHLFAVRKICKVGEPLSFIGFEPPFEWRPPFKRGLKAYEGEWFTDLANLSNCKKMRRLNLYGATTRSLQGIENFSELTHLDVGRCESLVDVSHLKSLTKLRLFEFAHTSFRPRPKGREYLAGEELRNYLGKLK